MRCGGANPSTEEVEAVVGTKTHLTMAQVEAGMSKQKKDGDLGGPMRDCLGIFDRLVTLQAKLPQIPHGRHNTTCANTLALHFSLSLSRARGTRKAQLRQCS